MSPHTCAVTPLLILGVHTRLTPLVHNLHMPGLASLHCPRCICCLPIGCRASIRTQTPLVADLESGHQNLCSRSPWRTGQNHPAGPAAAQAPSAHLLQAGHTAQALPEGLPPGHQVCTCGRSMPHSLARDGLLHSAEGRDCHLAAVPQHLRQRWGSDHSRWSSRTAGAGAG